MINLIIRTISYQFIYSARWYTRCVEDTILNFIYIYIKYYYPVFYKIKVKKVIENIY